MPKRGGDVLTREQRSYCMSRIRGRDTSPELLLRKQCWALGLRYRTTSRLIGKPDMVFGRQRVAVFVDGCFWHGCPQHYQAPMASHEFWRSKLEKNRRRDVVVNDSLAAEGW